ncbi:probable saccharopine reductase [Candidatus Vecturithrix granuli]|uniref:Probable saccharopine reductase n=1 Tax=Vecturithrix granuli TaxID=1499967 RepID=A0A0S6WA95_VECG1|nr:probable saccharopine reductase [Candidatus Vecturithrix granuli]
MKKVLVLGAGLVSKPLVHYLLDKGYAVKVASRTVGKAEALIQGYANGSAEALNVQDDTHLEQLVAGCDLAVSLLPYIYHVKIAELCIKHKKDMVTTSYVSDAMRALDGEAKKAGIIILNEIGVDPGIDHMSAMKVIHGVENKGGKVTSFRSYCGGLPALQSNTNPFGYKFSWSPRGVVMAGKNNGQFLQDGEVVFIPSKNLFREYELLDVEGLGTYEAYTNRNSLPYQEIYGLKDAHTVFRGTLRNIGWCETMKKAQELGLFDDTPREDLRGLTYQEMMAKLIDEEESYDIIEETAMYLNLETYSTVIKKFAWLGLFDDTPLPDENNVMDMFCALLQKKLSMASDDADLLILYHQFIAEYPDKQEFITSTLIQTGEPGGESAMSRTVSLPAAIGVAMILEGKITLKGVHIPVIPGIYEPVLKELAQLGIACKECVTPLE